MGASGGGRGTERQRRPPSQEPGKGDNMGRTPEETMKALECCNKLNSCHECPYNEMSGNYSCLCEKNDDASALIQQLIKQNRALAEIKESYEKVISRQERENAAMLETLKRMAHCGGVCVGCVHMDDEPTILAHCEDLDFDCEKCPSPCACHSCKEGSNYTWKGVESADEYA